MKRFIIWKKFALKRFKYKNIFKYPKYCVMKNFFLNVKQSNNYFTIDMFYYKEINVYIFSLFII